MRKCIRFLAVTFIVFLFLAGSIVQVQAWPYSLVIDEYGSGYGIDLGISNPQWNTWNGQLQNDPTWTGHQSLRYVGAHANFPNGYFDVLVKDPTGVDSDILRFFNTSTYPLYTFVTFYSADTSGGALADTGLPVIRNVLYTVSEDSDGIFYWTSSDSSIGFKGYSDGHASVPEPTTMLLLGLGLTGIASIRRKFQK